VTEPVRRRLEQPSAEKQKRSGCITWGAVLGVLAGIMVGMYVLPPVLRHYYGEKTIHAGGTYHSGGKTVRVTSFGSPTDVAAEPRPGNLLREFYASLAAYSDVAWAPTSADFTLEFEEIDRHQPAEFPEGFSFAGIPAGAGPTSIVLRFVVELPADDFPETLTPIVLHLKNPRVRFELR
jgi:hypothetical protein